MEEVKSGLKKKKKPKHGGSGRLGPLSSNPLPPHPAEPTELQEDPTALYVFQTEGVEGDNKVDPLKPLEFEWVQ